MQFFSGIKNPWRLNTIKVCGTLRIDLSSQYMACLVCQSKPASVFLTRTEKKSFQDDGGVGIDAFDHAALFQNLKRCDPITAKTYLIQIRLCEFFISDIYF